MVSTSESASLSVAAGLHDRCRLRRPGSAPSPGSPGGSRQPDPALGRGSGALFVTARRPTPRAWGPIGSVACASLRRSFRCGLHTCRSASRRCEPSQCRRATPTGGRAT
jgi:hypothetical protein